MKLAYRLEIDFVLAAQCVNARELRVRSLPKAIARAQAILRRHVPEGVSLVDELIADRRREAERE